MKKRIVLISIIVFIIIAKTGSSLSWFLSRAGEETSDFTMGTVRLELVEEGFTEGEDIREGTYDKKVQVRSLGTEKTYVRLRLVPEWSNSSLPVSNLSFNLSLNQDWTEKEEDGYYYFKYYLEENQITSHLLDSLDFTEISPEYQGASFTLKIVAEGVQVTNYAWKAIWDLEELPFEPDQAWTQ